MMMVHILSTLDMQVLIRVISRVIIGRMRLTLPTLNNGVLKSTTNQSLLIWGCAPVVQAEI